MTGEGFSINEISATVISLNIFTKKAELIFSNQFRFRNCCNRSCNICTKLSNPGVVLQLHLQVLTSRLNLSELLLPHIAVRLGYFRQVYQNYIICF